MGVANPLSMSDEDFLKMNGPEQVAQPSNEDPTPKETTETEQTTTTTEEENTSTDIPNKEEVVDNQDTETEEESKPTEEDTSKATKEDAEKETPAKAEKDKVVLEDTKTQVDKSKPSTTGNVKEDTQKNQEDTDYAGFYQKIMTPFKASGRTVELKSAEEAIRLMQMGADYTRKLQQLQGQRKLVMMLEKNGLMDESKLSYLIDLDKKNPAAIQKLVKEAGINPMDIDVDAQPAYSAGNHSVSEEEVRLGHVVDELQSTPEGQQTIQTLTGWDDTSKEALWKNPEIAQLIHEQRQSGVYDRVSAEVDRQRMLGKIPPNTPFLNAYKHVGDELTNAGALNDLIKPTKKAPVTSDRKPVATKVVEPKAKVTNGEKVSAAAPSKNTPSKAQTVVNPLALSDEEFMKSLPK